MIFGKILGSGSSKSSSPRQKKATEKKSNVSAPLDRPPTPPPPQPHRPFSPLSHRGHVWFGQDQRATPTTVVPPPRCRHEHGRPPPYFFFPPIFPEIEM